MTILPFAPGALGVGGGPLVNGQGGTLMFLNWQSTVNIPALAQIVLEPVGNPSECLILENMFHPSTKFSY